MSIKKFLSYCCWLLLILDINSIHFMEKVFGTRSTQTSITLRFHMNSFTYFISLLNFQCWWLYRKIYEKFGLGAKWWQSLLASPDKISIYVSSGCRVFSVRWSNLHVKAWKLATWRIFSKYFWVRIHLIYMKIYYKYFIIDLGYTC